MSFPKGFLIGASTAAHQVEGNNIHSDYWAQEHLPHSSFLEPSGEACDHYHRYEDYGLESLDDDLQRYPGYNTADQNEEGQRSVG